MEKRKETWLEKVGFFVLGLTTATAGAAILTIIYKTLISPLGWWVLFILPGIIMIMVLIALFYELGKSIWIIGRKL